LVTVVVVLLCCLAAARVGIALAGPERWDKIWRAQVHPSGQAPTDGGYRLLFWRNWAVAVGAVALVVVAVDHARLSDDELYEAARTAVKAVDGSAGGMPGDRLEAVVEAAVGADLSVEQLESGDDESRSEKFQISRGEKPGEHEPAICIEITSVGGTNQSPVRYVDTLVSTGSCS
jgi:hypothetical protein